MRYVLILLALVTFSGCYLSHEAPQPPEDPHSGEVTCQSCHTCDEIEERYELAGVPYDPFECRIGPADAGF